MQPYPLYAVDFVKLGKKRTQAGADVGAIGGRVLAYENQLDHSVGRQHPRFLDKVIDRSGAIWPFDGRDCAERA
jgi:hypothetical protein